MLALSSSRSRIASSPRIAPGPCRSRRAGPPRSRPGGGPGPSRRQPRRPRTRPRASSRRAVGVVESALLAGDLGEGRLAPALAVRSPSSVARDKASPATVSATAQFPTSSSDLGQLEHRVACARPRRAAGRAAQVVDRRRVGVRRHGRRRRRAPGTAASAPRRRCARSGGPGGRGCRSIASGVGALDVAADPAVEHRPDAERQALVRDLLGHDVLEEVRLVGLAIERRRGRRRAGRRAAR